MRVNQWKTDDSTATNEQPELLYTKYKPLLKKLAKLEFYNVEPPEQKYVTAAQNNGITLLKVLDQIIEADKKASKK